PEPEPEPEPESEQAPAAQPKAESAHDIDAALAQEAQQRAAQARRSAIEELIAQNDAGSGSSSLSAAQERALRAYKSAIKNKVEANWARPPGARNIKCDVRISQLPGGDITNIELL